MLKIRFRIPKRYKKHAIAIMALIAITMMRETGILRLNFFGDNFESYVTTHNWVAGSKKENDLLDEKVNNLLISDSQRSSILEKKIEREISGLNVGTKYFAHASISGLYWTPLWKNTECKYRIEINRPDRHGVLERMSLYGTMNLRIYGVCSVDELKNFVAKRAKKEVLRAVSQEALQRSKKKAS